MGIYIGTKKIDNVRYFSGVGTDTSDATATAEKIISPYTAYVNGQKITGSLKTALIEVSTATEMNIILANPVVGNAYIFIGPTDETYTNKDIYIIESGPTASLYPHILTALEKEY